MRFRRKIKFLRPGFFPGRPGFFPYSPRFFPGFVGTTFFYFSSINSPKFEIDEWKLNLKMQILNIYHFLVSSGRIDGVIHVD